MVIQNIKKLLSLSGVIFFPILLFGQNKLNNAPIIIISDVKKTHFYLGDTVRFTIKNTTSHNRGYTIEAISMSSTSEPNKIFNNQLYTAYFNNDTSFFIRLKKSRQASKKKDINFIIPDYTTIPYNVTNNSLSIFHFVVHGKKIPKGIKVKLRIFPDIIDDEPPYIIETKAFWIFVNPI